HTRERTVSLICLWLLRLCLLLCLQAPQNLYGAFPIHAQAHQRALCVEHCPVAPVLPDRHTMSPLAARVRGQPVPCQPLLPFAPAVYGAMGPPRASVFVVLRHLHVVLATPACRPIGVLRGWLCRSLHLEPLGRLFNLRLDTGEVCPP